MLELGPFSGGIAKGLPSLTPGFRVVVADESPDLFAPLLKEIYKTPHAQRILFKTSPLSPLTFMDQSFDLVIFRGAFFFLHAAILHEIYRVLRPGGLAIMGGGYGSITPPVLIEEIAEESKRLNLLLGKRWITEEDLTAMINETSFQEEAEISKEGGLWVILRKRGIHGEEYPGLADAFCLGAQEIISLVGGGGKTTLMFSLARELQERGLKVITTTTTKIYEPSQEQTPSLVIEENLAGVMSLIREKLLYNNHVTLAAQRYPDGKIGGVSPKLIGEMARELSPDHIIVEADGARKLPLKAPGDHEPVIPPATTLHIPMIGIDALGRPLSEEVAFRPERVAELTGVKLSDPITPQLIATLITHPQGLLKSVPPEARIIPVLNKIETAEDLNGAREVARMILREEEPRIGRVVLARLFYHHPIVEVIQRRNGSEKAL